MADPTSKHALRRAMRATRAGLAAARGSTAIDPSADFADLLRGVRTVAGYVATGTEADPAPPAPNVAHRVPPQRERIAVLDLSFATPLTRRRFFASDRFTATVAEQQRHIGHATAFAVSGMYTYVRDGELTLAGLRGSRPAQLIERLGAVNQTRADVCRLLLTGEI